MTEQQNICPYTGLRSFTEEESLYFKGRDLQVDQITALLEQNKFLMVTGASGEGKSSLIYAGLLPNARAGFFKAKYANWVVADFRPERNPVRHMADALAATFAVSASTVETELRRGYSSLVDLYTSSGFYIDEQDNNWNQLEETERKERKRKAANLMIIVDQFEEFFTNPENFFNEAPSQDSQVVVNLVLETARIAISRNLPVYLICTMRSDYIGQCAAFRGLPEYIGFSQFFVPRLKRKDLKQVIEEPAILSGNRISQRLIERLVFDISEGIDQLPILQHALNQIWHAAGNGNEEMDLLHYAMVGGMPLHDLPDEDQARFRQWFELLPEVQKKYFQETGLNKVIEIHASVLYENAWEYYNKNNPGKQITQYNAKRIIALAFSCLTKIDNSRAVRNRMSLGEITGIINTPELTADVVCGVLNIYREEGNSFIRPFRTADLKTHVISPDTVLDITHESLIRNWNKLNRWASQEFDYYTTYLDFLKQMDRWRQSGKSSDFLLPIGPLTYFENWYRQCKPNEGWIRRYSDIQGDATKAAEQAGKVLEDIREFIRRSARKVAVTRAFMKYGPQRIAVIVAFAVMLVLSGFYWYDAEQKQNEQVIREVIGDIDQLMKSNEVGFNVKSVPLLINERHAPGSMLQLLSEMDAKGRLSLSLETYKKLLEFDKHIPNALKQGLVQLVQANFTELLAREKDYPFLMTELNNFSTLLAYDNYYNPSDSTAAILQDIADMGFRLTGIFLGDNGLFRATIPVELNYGIQQWLTFGRATREHINTLLSQVSPFESNTAGAVFNVYYPLGNYEINGRLPNNFNGGYHTLASLYAATGNTDNVIRCFEAIRQSGQNEYFTGSLFNNYNNILAILYQYGFRDKAESIVRWLSTNYITNTPTTIYRNAFIRSGYLSFLYQVNIEKANLRSFKGYFFPNLCLSNRDVFTALGEDYDKHIAALPNSNERAFLMAMNKKRRAMFIDKYNFDRGFTSDSLYLDSLLSEAVDQFRKIDPGYLDTAMIPVTLPYFIDGVRNSKIKRKDLFIYPDYMDGWFSLTYHTDLFFNFLYRHHLFDTLYTTPQEMDMIHFWVAKAFEIKPTLNLSTFDNNLPMRDAILQRILDLAQTHPQGKSIDKNLVCLLLANRAFERNDTTSGMRYYNLFDKNNFAASRDKYEYLEKTFFLNALKTVCVNLAKAGRHEEATAMAEKFEKDYERAFVYISMSEKMYLNNSDPMAFVYLDSVFAKSADIDFSLFSFGNRRAIDIRNNWILLMSRIGGRQLNALSDNLLAEVLEGNKFGAIISRVYGVAEEGNLYRAKMAIPATLTETEDLIANSFILWQACRKKETPEEQERWKPMDRFMAGDFNYIFFIPN